MAPVAAGLELAGVDFHYPGAEAAVLHDVSFRADPGRRRPSSARPGAGKTTLLGLIPRLFDASAGKVRVGGVDVRDLELDDLWSKIGLVPQKPVPLQRHGRDQPALRQP